MSKIRAAITGIEVFLPEYRLTNRELSTMVDTNDEWIMQRIGIKERRILKGDLATSDMMAAAAKKLLESTHTSPDEIDFVIAATNTPDMWLPSTACIVCDKAGIRNAWGFDLLAACSSFIFALETVNKFVESGQYKKVLLLAGDKMSSIVDYTDRNTCPLFGDAATALLIEPTTEDVGVMDHNLHADGAGAPYLNLKAGGSKLPASYETVNNRLHYVQQDGKTVFKYAVSNMADVAVEMMERHSITPDDLAYLVPHQANLRIIDAVGRRMGLPPEKVMINIEKYGNTTSATIPLCLYEWKDKLKKGDKLILAAFGGGFTWGSLYLKWAL
ncbi:MAG: ketoacyl-ACP synthase III [Bacteroidales bacterium]|jgi:3-oxoacyl-[acyl-carrier-protein] synthase-3|nr:ketoacyl-ACP synthase III [Bacteroidales bacterium]